MRSLPTARRVPVERSGSTHADTVSPFVPGLSGVSCATWTKSFDPSNDRPRPKRPDVVRLAPEIVPSLPPVWSTTVLPLRLLEAVGRDLVRRCVHDVHRARRGGRLVAGRVTGDRSDRVRAVDEHPRVVRDRVRRARVGGADRVLSTVNVTFWTPTLSLAVALSVTEFATVAPSAGADTATVGAVVSGTVTLAAADAPPTFPAASSATTL